MVQVLWNGTFNLLHDAALRSYQGKAWWDARITAVNMDGSESLVHYPSWESDTWDEWVPAHRLRWPPQVLRLCRVPGRSADSRTLAESGTIAPPGTAVEVQCPSEGGVSPWLETVVSSVQIVPVPQEPDDTKLPTPHVRYVCRKGMAAEAPPVHPSAMRLSNQVIRQGSTPTLAATAAVGCSPRRRPRRPRAHPTLLQSFRGLFTRNAR